MQRRRGRFGIKRKECRRKFTYSCSTQIGFGVASAASALMELEEHNRLTKQIAETNAVIQSLPDQLAVWKDQCNNGIEKQWADAYHMSNTNSAITNLFKDLEDESS